MKGALKDVRREATSLGYPPEDIDSTEFAVVAFLDEVILSSDDTARDTWAKKTLGVEMFGEAVAGEIFFENIDSFRKRSDSPNLADLLEVYLLCLLLGFEGRYAGMKGELHAISSRLRNRIDAIRQTDPRLTPDAIPELEKQAFAPHFVRSTPRWKLIAIAGFAAAVAMFLLLKLNLWWGVRSLISALRI
jgi:type VI secretion system protein ImpK